MAQPKIGDKIIHHDPMQLKPVKGKVVQILSMQFVYENDANEQCFCFFTDNWSPNKK